MLQYKTIKIQEKTNLKIKNIIPKKYKIQKNYINLTFKLIQNSEQ